MSVTERLERLGRPHPPRGRLQRSVMVLGRHARSTFNSTFKGASRDSDLYKHRDTRRYLNLDDAGHAYDYWTVAG